MDPEQLLVEMARTVRLMAECQAKAAADQAATMHRFLSFFEVTGTPVPRMNGDQHYDAKANELANIRAGYPATGSEREQLEWILLNT